MELLLFDEVAEALRSLLPDTLGELRVRTHRYGAKVWFGGEAPPREHYEAQVIGPKHVDDAEILAIEVGFHAEHRNPAENEQVLAGLLKHQKRWRKVLGDDAVAGDFLGQVDDWKRVSETWPDPDLGDPDLGFELATRLFDYVTALEPVRHATAVSS